MNFLILDCYWVLLGYHWNKKEFKKWAKHYQIQIDSIIDGVD